MTTTTIFSGQFTTGTDTQLVMANIRISYLLPQSFPGYGDFLDKNLTRGASKSVIGEIIGFRRGPGTWYELAVIDRSEVLKHFATNNLRAATTKELLNFIVKYSGCLTASHRTQLLGLGTSFFHGSEGRHEDVISVLSDEKLGEKPWVSCENISNRIPPLWENLPYRDRVFDSMCVFLGIRDP